ncbi:Aspartic proteinase nepenthesin-1 precursor, putative [Ricinus communis]|uniref:Aspartic proteinase nepenthesin-1, putative n=1 Tax=Ricinus communis TaxID=3988 RepID=B9SL69_RICCO|nr:Aspartic proteinase nepenthesin-1 precursor, putative [Ricinus communis]
MGSFRLFFFMICIQTLLCFSSSLPDHVLLKDNRLGFKVPLLHWLSTESPFYEPNLTLAELTQASIRTSGARGDSIRSIMSGNITSSMKYPISRMSYTDKAYVMKFSIGSPAVDTYAIPDSGSSLVWLQCGTPYCRNCYRQKIPLFNPSKSVTYMKRLCNTAECRVALGDEYWRCKKPNQICKYHEDYLDDSYTEGVISTDIFTFPEHISGFGNYTLRIIFGCGYNNSDPQHFYPPGLVGLTNNKASLVGQMDVDQFSYCVSIDTEQNLKGSMEIRFGLAASISGHSTQLVPNSDGWYIFKNVDGIYVNEFEVEGYPAWVFKYTEGGQGGLTMDTGTTYTELHNSVMDPLIKLLEEHITIVPEKDYSNSGFELCYFSDDFLGATLPDIELRFTDNKDTYFSFNTRNAWTPNGRSQMCLAMFRTNGMSIIGMHQLRDIKIGYDLHHNIVSFTDAFGCKI